jgi:glycosyltransferase involved in cell wall biosynthesis
MEHLHIIHVSTATSWRGGEQQLAYLITGLHQTDITQEVLCTDGAPFAVYCEKQGIKKTVFKKQGSLNLKAARMLANICRNSQNCIVHCHDSHAHNIAFFSALIFKNPSPVIVHRRVDFPASNSFVSKAKYNHPSIARYICVSEAIRNMLLPSIKDPEKALVVYSGIDLSRFSNIVSKNTLRGDLGLPGDCILIGNVSALAPHKDYLTFIGTAEKLLKNNPHFHFVIIGEGPERTIIEKEIETRKLAGKISLTGFKTNVPELLKELDVLLLTSKTEGLGTSILDAFASGLPVVATKAGGIPEIVEHKVNGLLAETGNAQALADMVELLLTEEFLRKSLVENARIRVREFDYKVTAAKILEVYKGIAGVKNK